MSELPHWPSGDDDDSGPSWSMSRSVLGALLAVVLLAVLLAIWFLATRGDESADPGDDTTTAAAVAPTPLPIPTSTPIPAAAAANPATPTSTPIASTPIPAGFEACGDSRAPLVTSTYIVDTVSTPLNQRSAPSVDGDLVGTFEPGLTGLTFTGECVVNLSDGYVWWAIDNGTEEVWIASDFVTPN